MSGPIIVATHHVFLAIAQPSTAVMEDTEAVSEVVV